MTFRRGAPSQEDLRERLAGRRPQVDRHLGGRARPTTPARGSRTQPRRTTATPTAPPQMRPTFSGARRNMVLPTRNRLATPVRMQYRGGVYVPGGFSGTAGRPSPFAVGGGTLLPSQIRASAYNRGTYSPQAMQRFAFNRWRRGY